MFFPAVESTLLYPYPPQVIPLPCVCGSSRPSISPHMFAMLCSNPLVMKVNMHHQISRILAASLLVRVASHTPRHTSQLASTARQSNCSHGRFILVAAT